MGDVVDEKKSCSITELSNERLVMLGVGLALTLLNEAMARSEHVEMIADELIKRGGVVRE